MKVAIYARVSTEEQHAENQIPVLQEWAKARGWEVVNVYAEDATAWKAGHQKEWAQLVKDARMGKFKIVLIWALDRMCRGGPGAIFEIMGGLNNYGVKVYSHQEAWTEQTEGPMYELLLSVYAWVAEAESRRRSERTKIGMARARTTGSHIGRPRTKKDKLVQLQDSSDGHYVLIDAKSGAIIAKKKDDGPYKRIPLAKKAVPFIQEAQLSGA